MFKLYKNGGLAVNNPIFEYICDSEEDLANIPRNKINLGSTAVVLDNSEGIRVFISNSKDQWIEVTSEMESAGSSYVLTKEKIVEALGTDIGEDVSEIKIDLRALKDEIDEKIEDIEERLDEIESAPGGASASGTYELLNTITADGTYNAISLTKDDNENEYDLISAYVEFETAKASSTASIRTFVNDNLVANNVNSMTTSGSAENPLKSSEILNIEYGMLKALVTTASTSVTNSAVQSYGKLLKSGYDSINKIEFVSSSTVKIPNKSIIRVYGVKR